jgi:uncharacterized protein (DUF4213/DUF364 family)
VRHNPAAKSESYEIEAGSIAARIVAGLLASARAVRVADVRIGLGYTAVMLADGRVGVAYTFRDHAPAGCTVFHGIRPLSERPTSDLLALLKSKDPIEACVGLASANALANVAGDGFLEGDLLDHLDLGPSDDVGLVGNFRPLVRPLEERARSLTIFERVSTPRGKLRPAEEAAAILPNCQVALITATSIINHTVESLLRSTRGCREVAVIGASTPLLPWVFSATNVTLLSGVIARQPAEVLRVVSEGGGMRVFNQFVDKVSLRTESAKRL